MQAQMEKVIELLNRMQADGVIERFAIGGGIATIYEFYEFPIYPYRTQIGCYFATTPMFAIVAPLVIEGTAQA